MRFTPFLFLVLLPAFLQAQSIRFSEFYDNDLGAGAILNIVPLEDEGFIAQGPNWKNSANQSHTIHLDSNGGLLNTDIVSSSGIGYEAFGLLKLDDGQIVGAGSLCDYNTVSPSRCDFYFSRFDGEGNSVFTQVYERIDTCDLLLDMVQTRPNKIMLIGWTCNDTTENNTDLMFITVDTLGNELNRVVWGGSGTDYVHSGLVINEFGEVLMTGYTASFAGNDNDTWLVKTDSIGNVMWHQEYNHLSPSGGDSGLRISALEDGNYVAVGGGENTTTGFSDAYIMKIDPSGNVIWTKKYVLPKNQGFLGCQGLADGSIVACGQTTLTDDDSQAGWLVKADENGDTLWTRTYNPSIQIDRLLNMIVMPNGDIVMVGSGRPEGQTNQDGWILRVDSMGCEIEDCFSVGIEEEQKEAGLSVYPNPVTDVLHVRFADDVVHSSVVITITDMLGRTVLRFSEKSNMALDVSALKGGVYMLRATDVNGKMATVKFVKE